MRSSDDVIAFEGYSVGASADWKTALQQRLDGVDPPIATEAGRPLRVLPLENTQAHALTCSKAKGSMGHHFRVLGGKEGGDGGNGAGTSTGPDALQPSIDDAIAALHKFEWVGK